MPTPRPLFDYRPDLIALTGGGPVALDGQEVGLHGYPIRAVVMLVLNDAPQQWLLRLRAFGEAENGASLIEPDNCPQLIWQKLL